MGHLTVSLTGLATPLFCRLPSRCWGLRRGRGRCGDGTRCALAGVVSLSLYLSLTRCQSTLLLQWNTSTVAHHRLPMLCHRVLMPCSSRSLRS